jgi:nitronate monooxygenase
VIPETAYPVVQAGLGGGLAAHELAAAVSEAGGLGQIGLHPPAALREELAAARKLTGKPIAINLIVPLARRGHWEVAEEADAVVTHWEGRPRRRTASTWIHTVGSPEEALRAVSAGADAVIAQGVESGGHVRGTEPGLQLLERVRAAIPDGYPVLMAGGIAGAADVRTALEAGAVAAVAGTRFLMSDESRAHPVYKRRLVDGADTVLTELFGIGWPRAPHRVLPNAATDRWLGGDRRGPAYVRSVHALISPLARSLPGPTQRRMAARARGGFLDLSAQPPVEGLPEDTIQTHPLYAGETVARIDDVRPAAELVAELTP